MAKAPGSPKTGGRKAGTPNKATTRVKDALIEAFDNLGGVDALVEFGRENPGEFYKLWVKVLPSQINDKGPTEPVEVIIKRATKPETNGDS